MVYKELELFYLKTYSLEKLIIMRLLLKNIYGGSKRILLLLLLCQLYGCDIATPLLVNGEQACFFSAECGKVELTAQRFGGDTFILFSNIADCVVNVDSIEFDTLSHYWNPDDVVLFIDGRGRVCKNGSRPTSCHLKTRSMKANQKCITLTVDTIYLPPSNLITCNGIPLITDTIKLYKDPRKTYY